MITVMTQVNKREKFYSSSAFDSQLGNSIFICTMNGFILNRVVHGEAFQGVLDTPRPPSPTSPVDPFGINRGRDEWYWCRIRRRMPIRTDP
jgi:hypothetical protein